MIPEKTETEIKKEITDYLKALNYKVYRMPASMIGHKVKGVDPGTPDLFAVGDHFTLWIEVKKPGKRPTEIQVEQMIDLLARGEHCLCADSVEKVTSYLKYYGALK